MSRLPEHSYFLKSGDTYISFKVNAIPSASNFCQPTSENKLLEHHSALYKHLLKHQHKMYGLIYLDVQK